jgi:alkyl hydroperoxide reductase subunit AhpC
MPILDEVFRRYKPIGFKLLSINIDDDRERAVQISQSLGVSYPVLYDRRKKVSRKYEVTRMPSIILVDREGVVRHWHHGYDRATEERYLQQLRALLRE